MKYQKKWDIHEQVRELRVVLALQEQGFRAFKHGPEKTIIQNRESIHHLKTLLREDFYLLHDAQKYDKKTIDQAFKGQKKRRLSFGRSTVEQAKDSLEKYVFDSKNVLNKLLYEVKKRQRALVELNSLLETLKLMQLAEKPDSAEQQQIRQLENSIEKVETKLAAANAIHRTYLKILDYLKEEVLYFPGSLGVMADTVNSYSHELATMTSMADEASIARDAITSELSEMEKRYIEDRKTRENTMNWQRRMLKDLVDKQHLRREGPKKVMNVELESLLGRENPVQALAKAEAEKSMTKSQQKLFTDIDNLKNAVHCSKIEDIAGRLADLEETTERLQKHVDDTNQKQEQLLAQLHSLELQQVERKFHDGRGSESFDALDVELRNNLKLEEERLLQMKQNLFHNQELFLTIKNGIDNLYVKLYGISPPRKDSETPEGRQKTPKESYKKLDICQAKLLYLLETESGFLQEGWLKDERAEPFLQVRDMLETSTTHEPNNRRIKIEYAQDSAEDTFEFEGGHQEYAPSREDIKKESQSIIEMKKKVGKSPKKKEQKQSHKQR
ncbi:coiled-coil domain-containing protein 183 [Lissotriton helveticus]